MLGMNRYMPTLRRRGKETAEDLHLSRAKNGKQNISRILANPHTVGNAFQEYLNALELVVSSEYLPHRVVTA